MEKALTAKGALFSTTVLKVLDFLLQHPELELIDTEIAGRLMDVRKSAVNVALRKLAAIGFIQRTPRGNMTFNKLFENPIIDEFKILSNLLAIDPLIENIKDCCTKIVLFGSRADGTHTSESDFDLLIVTSDEKKIFSAIKKDALAELIQPVIKSPEEMLTFSKDDPALYKEIKKGRVLWEAEYNPDSRSASSRKR
jgi:predicted nucleotidyltransferase